MRAGPDQVTAIHLNRHNLSRRLPPGSLLVAAAAIAGRLAGTWRATRRGRRLRLAIEPFGPLPVGVRDDLAAEAQVVAGARACTTAEVTFEG